MVDDDKMSHNLGNMTTVTLDSAFFDGFTTFSLLNEEGHLYGRMGQRGSERKDEPASSQQTSSVVKQDSNKQEVANCAPNPHCLLVLEPDSLSASPATSQESDSSQSAWSIDTSTSSETSGVEAIASGSGTKDGAWGDIYSQNAQFP